MTFLFPDLNPKKATKRGATHSPRRIRHRKYARRINPVCAELAEATAAAWIKKHVTRVKLERRRRALDAELAALNS